MQTKVRLLITLFAVAMTALYGCTPDDLNYQREDGPMHTVTINATSESPGTKSEIGDDLIFSWTPGDQIAVYAGSQYYTSAAYVSGNRFSVQLSGTRTNFALYPASIADEQHVTAGDLAVTLPESYDLTGKSSTYSPMPMLAVNVEGADLAFMHLGGLLRITLVDLPAETSYVTVDLGKVITGSFPVTIDPAGGYIVAGDGESTPVKFLLPSSGNTVLNLPVPTGEYTSIEVKAYDANDTCLGTDTPSFSWTCNRAHGKKLTDENLGWTFVFGTLNDGTVPYWGGDVSLSAAFVSYKTKGTTTEAVPYTLEYSEDGGTTWTTALPTWLAAGPAEGSHAGDTEGESLAVTVAPQVNSTPDPHHVELSKVSRIKTDFDLSTFNVAADNWNSATGIGARTTANCYVVQGPGTYKFPLVYGNGVKNGTINEVAYRAKSNVNAAGFRPDDGITNYLGRFKDHLDMNIMSPYITTQQFGKALSATLVWTDAPGLVTDVALSGSGEDCYLTFSVPAEYITQGNALVAVLADDDADGTPETIAWSWHIWVTDDDMTTTKEGSNGFMFAPVNLGWCGSKTETYVQRNCQVRVTQSQSGNAVTCILTQTEGSVTLGGNSSYYQWGRKDPIQASLGGSRNDNKPYYPSIDVYSPPDNIIVGNQTLGNVIQTPYVQYYPSGSYPRNWCSQIYHNLWNSVINGIDADQPVIKTIYDPSPAGFKIPSPLAYSGFTKDNFSWGGGVSWGGGGRTYNNTLYFPAGGYRPRRIPTNCGSHGYYWSAMPAGDRGRRGNLLSFAYDVVTPNNQRDRSDGLSIRPVIE